MDLQNHTDPEFCQRIFDHITSNGNQLNIEMRPKQQEKFQYYRGMQFNIYTTTYGHEYELVDGGFVDWTQKLLGDGKERLLISGLGTERLHRLS